MYTLWSYTNVYITETAVYTPIHMVCADTHTTKQNQVYKNSVYRCIPQRIHMCEVTHGLVHSVPIFIHIFSKSKHMY